MLERLASECLTDGMAEKLQRNARASPAPGLTTTQDEGASGELAAERKCHGEDSSMGASRERTRGAREILQAINAQIEYSTVLLSAECLVTRPLSLSTPLMQTDATKDGFDERLRQRTMANSNPLDTIPKDASLKPRGVIPNTPLAISAVSFLLGSLFALGGLTFAVGGFSNLWWSTYQLGFFVAAWAAFHWGEFAVTAGWNKDKCSVDCESSLSRSRKHVLICALMQHSSLRMGFSTT